MNIKPWMSPPLTDAFLSFSQQGKISLGRRGKAREAQHIYFAFQETLSSCKVDYGRKYLVSGKTEPISFGR